MSAAAAYWMDGGDFEAFAVFPEYPNLLERGCQDGVDRLYVECHQRGNLLTEGIRVSDVGALLHGVRRRWGDPVDNAKLSKGAHGVRMMRPSRRFWQ